MRPFGKTDINFIISGRFATLENATKAVYHVITGLVSFHNGQFFHSAPSIAELAGYSVGSAERALRELLDEKVISVVLRRPGETTVYQYNFVADGADRGGYSDIDPRPIPRAAQPPPIWTPEAPPTAQPDPQPPSSMTQPSLTHEGGPPSPMRDKQELFNEIRTTTAADRISSSLIQKLKSKYGEDRVNPVVVAMQSMNGEVKNANAYFHSAVTQGYTPTSKKFRKEQKKREREKAIDERQEQRKQEFDKMVRDFEESDPAAIEQEIAKANRILGIE